MISQKKYNRTSAFFLFSMGMALFIISNGRWIVPLAAWIAPIPLLLFTRSQKPAFGLAYLVIPLDHPELNRENKSVFINPTGAKEWEYLKTYPVPGSTNKPGNGILPLSETHFGLLSSAICYDMDFTQLIHQAGKANVDIMLVPAWDWKAIDPLHARMAVFRAIENGFSIVRQTGEGLSIATDYQGRTLSVMDHFKSDQHTMLSKIPTQGSKTLYAVIGDLFAYICLAGLLLSIGFSFFSKTNKEAQ